MNVLTELFGRLHPVLVHLPIGFLLLALVFQWLAKKEKYLAILPAIRIAFLLGMISAVVSCLSGWSLSSGGEYDETTLDLHRYFGIGVAVFSVAGYWHAAKPSSGIKNILSLLIFLLIIITGHLGGTLTHGEGFLTKGIFGDTITQSKSVKKTIANVQEAIVYADIIQPVLIDKCSSCHNAKKQKGGLRLDEKEWILKGGKDGQVFISGNPNGSELYKRVVLDPLEEKHMPPKGKPQLTEQETGLIQWWIRSNAGFDKKVKEVSQTAQVMHALLAMQETAVIKKTAIPEEMVERISPVILDSLRNAGIIVLPVAANSNYLLANFVSIPNLTDQTISLLHLISKQLVWLKLAYAALSENSWKMIGQCKNLTRLSIEHTNITDAGMMYLSSLKNLQYLNLVGTKISVQGVLQIKNIPALENIYLSQTLVTTNDFLALKKQFPKTILDSGNYHVEKLIIDTQLLKAPPAKK